MHCILKHSHSPRSVACGAPTASRRNCKGTFHPTLVFVSECMPPNPADPALQHVTARSSSVSLRVWQPRHQPHLSKWPPSPRSDCHS